MKSIPRLLLAAFVVLICSSRAIAENRSAGLGDVPTTTQATLGIAVSSLPEMLSVHLAEVIDQGRGVLVADVVKGSPADKAGIQRFDILVRYDDQDLYSPEQLAKRIRNDQPGSTVALEFVRAGQRQSVKVTLEEQPEREKVYANRWPGLAPRFNVPWTTLRPDFWTAAQDASNEGTEWTEFESLSVTKQADGTYRVRIVYNDHEGKTIDREYAGDRQQIRDALNGDKELPKNRKEQLLRTLDDRGRKQMTDFNFQLPDWNQWRQELFNWPNAEF
ncbi:S1C family serine protease [Rhodopirellula sp. JC639]|uniref:S1C family serine protease n=1 Tax=Stieleria mannarensis TaxID=2755585 RepID=UPI001600DCB6|nr:PDZ domain-containing protein [Rhodopirellula sp. JC639]